MKIDQKAIEAARDWLDADCHISTVADVVCRELLRLAESQRGDDGNVGADRLAYEVARLVERGDLNSRSAAADALLDYLGIGGMDGPKSVPEWMANYRALTGKELEPSGNPG